MHLSRNPGTKNEEKLGEIARDSRREDGEWIVAPTFGGFGQEGKEEHVDDSKSMLQDLTLDVIPSKGHDIVHKDLDQHT